MLYCKPKRSIILCLTVCRVCAVTCFFVYFSVFSAEAQQAGFRDELENLVLDGAIECDGTFCHRNITPYGISPDKRHTGDDHFDTWWNTTHMTEVNGIMTLQLDDCPDDKEECGGWPYASAEYQSKESFGYGCFSGRMKAAKESGVISSFFTYTWNPWDEIDIEFPGNNTTSIQTGYFVNGSNTDTNEGDSTFIVHELGFDAADDFHIYQIDWQNNYIAWLVDGKEIRRVDSSVGPLPQANMQLMANLWTGKKIEQWVGEFTYSGPVTTQYDWLAYSPESCSETDINDIQEQNAPTSNNGTATALTDEDDIAAPPIITDEDDIAASPIITDANTASPIDQSASCICPQGQ